MATAVNTQYVASYLAGKTIYPDQLAALYDNSNPQPDGSFAFDLASAYQGSAYYQLDTGGISATDPSYVVSYNFAASPGNPANWVNFTVTYGDGSTLTDSAEIVGINGDYVLMQNTDTDGSLIPGSYSVLSLAPLTNLDNEYNNGTFPPTLPLDFNSTGTGTWELPGDAASTLSGTTIPVFGQTIVGGKIYDQGYYTNANPSDVTETFPGIGVGGAYNTWTVTKTLINVHASLGNYITGEMFSTAGLSASQIAAGQIDETVIYKNSVHGPTNLDTILGWTGSGASSEILLGQGTPTTLPNDTLQYANYDILFASLQGQSGPQLIFNTPPTFTTDVSATALEAPACFAAGTRIRTVRGEVAVEDLAIGDAVLTVQDDEAATRPVVWIGSRHVDVAAHPAPHTVRPIRILRGAFGEALPGADLVVSPDHALFVDGKLIAARLLVNGATIVEDAACRAVHYFHVELDRHAALFAENLPAESYLDTGNRAAFATGTTVLLHADFSAERRLLDRAAASCAPFAVDEAAVKPVWTRLAARAKALGFAIPVADAGSDDPALTVSVMGRTVQRVRIAQDRYAFVLPAGAERITLSSRTARPSATAPWLNDRRELGVSVGRITLRDGDGTVRDIAIDHPGLCEGWWSVERVATQAWRWTDGNAVLDLAEGAAQPRVLEITLAGGIAYPVALTLSRAA